MVVGWQSYGKAPIKSSAAIEYHKETKKGLLPMPNKDKKGPKGQGPKDGHGEGKGIGKGKPAGPKKGGKKGEC
jgi:hypothetical protein